MSDPIHGHYRSKDEVEEQKKYDPISVFAEILKAEKLADDEWIEAAEKRIKAIVDECVTFAEDSPEPPLENLYKVDYEEPNGE
jgi:pyruvate dehydrogenase E1 component alpha subunit